VVVGGRVVRQIAASVGNLNLRRCVTDWKRTCSFLCSFFFSDFCRRLFDRVPPASVIQRGMWRFGWWIFLAHTSGV